MKLSPLEIIQKKRDQKELSPAEVQSFIEAYTKGEVPDYQASAFLMASFINGLVPSESAALTEAMLNSGKRLNLRSLNRPIVDKHSTGGVGDKTSIVIAPLVAAAGVVVPMITGRGLGHTGGTTDKLESIPGFKMDLSLEKFKEQLSRIGVAITGQTEEIAPADRKLYSLRDVTGTVESIPLITASIMSKKLAEDIDGLSLDIKVGNGAFMKTHALAKSLATSLVETGKRFNVKVEASLTNMDQPLGSEIGNSREILECLQILKNESLPKTSNDLKTLCLHLSGSMLNLAGVSKSLEEGIQKASELLENGAALQKFKELLIAQGGDPRVIDDPALLPLTLESTELLAPHSGRLTQFETMQIGLAVVDLGGGRKMTSDVIDPRVGITLFKKCGELVREGEPLMRVYSPKTGGKLNSALERLQSSFTIEHSDKNWIEPPLIYEVTR